MTRAHLLPAPSRSLMHSRIHSPSNPMGCALILALTFSLSSSLSGCEAPPPEPTPVTKSGDTARAAKSAEARESKPRAPKERPKRKIKAKPAAEVAVSPDDPLKGTWSLEDATKGLTGEGALVATITTSLGKLECKLLDDKAPITVANFVGLARGLRPWKNKEGEWVKKAAYDATLFHRIVKGFMVQGGTQNGGEEAGYVIPDEVWEDANHDKPGLLCMANRGKNTNSKQFFITHDAALHLDGGYTIFGECGPLDVLDKIATVAVKGEKPVDPPAIESITIARKAMDGAAPATSASADPAAGAAPTASAAPAAGSAKPGG